LPSAAIASSFYALALPGRLTRAIGITLGARDIAIGLISSLLSALAAFMALFAAFGAVMMLARAAGRERRFGFVGALEYWGFVLLLAASVTLVEARLVGASLAFAGRDAWVASAALGITVAATWAGVARVRAHAPPAPSPQSRLQILSRCLQGPSPATARESPRGPSSSCCHSWPTAWRRQSRSSTGTS
jgi:hypothetical protein